MAVSKRTRFEVLRRDNYTCRYCRSTENALTIDHVTPLALGGTDDPANLVAACRDCNAGKASSAPDASLVTDVSDDAIRWAQALAEVARARAGARQERESYVADFEQEWAQWHYGYRHEPIPRDSGWEQSIWRFYELGLPIGDLADAVKIACGNSRISPDATWRYMCGIAWKMLAEVQESAREAVHGGE
jgi:hypothetical protein